MTGAEADFPRRDPRNPDEANGKFNESHPLPAQRLDRVKLDTHISSN